MRARHGVAAGAVDERRLRDRHAEMAKAGATGRGGVNRQALTAEDGEARGLPSHEAESVRPEDLAAGTRVLTEAPVELAEVDR